MILMQPLCPYFVYILQRVFMGFGMLTALMAGVEACASEELKYT